MRWVSQIAAVNRTAPRLDKASVDRRSNVGGEIMQTWSAFGRPLPDNASARQRRGRLLHNGPAGT